MLVKAVIFDIGGVVVGSPVVGLGLYEASRGLPKHYLNNVITARGNQGAFQRLERSELALADFYVQFGQELSDVEVGNRAYRELCKKQRIECPPLPTENLDIDGEEVWKIMMSQATEPDPIVLNAINHLRQNPNLKLAALTNNFVGPETESSALLASSGRTVTPLSRHEIVTAEQIRRAYLDSNRVPGSSGVATDALKGLFDFYIESALVGMRKPDPKFYQYALDLIGVKAEEAVFLDDIGHNLVAARKMGIHTIRVYPGRSREAVQELAKLVRMDLQTPLVGQARL